MSRFAGRTVVVTGGAAGIGFATAEAFFAEGAHVVLGDRDPKALDRAVQRLAGHNGQRVLGVPCDVSDAAQVDALVTGTIERLGALDVLVNNAGVTTFGAFVELPEAEWDLVMDVNAKGVFLCCQAAARAMLDRDGGVIVNVASQAGKRGQPYIAHYCASKAAVISLTRTLALEAAPSVRVNAVCPGEVTTPMMEHNIRWAQDTLGQDADTVRQGWLDQIPLKRFQAPADIAAAILFLASDAASEITGQTLNVDGGILDH